MYYYHDLSSGAIVVICLLIDMTLFPELMSVLVDSACINVFGCLGSLVSTHTCMLIAQIEENARD